LLPEFKDANDKDMMQRKTLMPKQIKKV
jgi:hypothetical protein